MAVTTTPTAWRRPARPPRRARPRPAGRRRSRRCRPVFLDAPADHLGGQTIPLTKAERHDRPAPGVRATSPDKVARVGPCTAGTGGGPWGHGQAHIPRADGTSLQPVGTGSGRTDRRTGPPISCPRWHPIKAGHGGAVSARPALAARTVPGGVGPGRQRAVPGTRSRPGLPGYRAGEGGACRGLNMAHTTFPASLGAV